MAPVLKTNSDRELLERFASGEDELAFAELVQRHGAMELGVSRRMLCSEHDAEDVFQATFLVLARKAGSVCWRESVAGWLYEVAFHIAWRERAKVGRRRYHEKEAAAMHGTTLSSAKSPPGDLSEVLDEELRHLPRKYREPILLCYLEGKSSEEAAQELGCPGGTVKTRLARARNLLHTRLTRRGLALPSIALLSRVEIASAASLSPMLARSAVKASCLFAAGKHQAMAGVVSAQPIAMARTESAA